MARTPTRLPIALAASGFTVAEAREAGVSTSRLRATDLRSPAWGIRHDAGVRPSFLDRARVLSKRHPGSFLSHETAARYWALHVDAPGLDMVDLGVPAPLARPRGVGIRGHRLRLGDRELVATDDVAVTSPARTWLDLADSGLGTEDLIVAADRILCRRRPLATIHELERILVRHPGSRGIRLLRSALVEAIEDSDSSRETRLRMRIVAAGLPRPVAAHSICDADGREVAKADLAFPDYRVLLEYEGAHHLTDRRQWAIDLDRFNRFQELGWLSLRIGAAQFDALAATIALVERALATRGWTR